MLTWIKTIARTITSQAQTHRASRRRATRLTFRGPVEVCEARLCLNGGYTLPINGGVLATPLGPTTNPYSGDWDGSFDHLQLTQNGRKIRGTYTGLHTDPGATVKGKADGNDAVLKIKGQGTSIQYGHGKFKSTLEVTLDTPNHFAGTRHVIFAGHDLGNATVDYNRSP